MPRNPYPAYERATSTMRRRFLVLLIGVAICLPLGAWLGYEFIRADLIGACVGLFLMCVPLLVLQVVVGVLGSLHQGQSSE